MRKPVFADLVAVIKRHARYDFLTPIKGLMVARCDTPTEVMQSVYKPSFGLVVAGEKTLVAGETPLLFSANESLVVAVDVPVTSQVTQASPAMPYLAMHLEIDPAVVAALIREQSGQVAKVANMHAVGKCALDPELIDPLIRLVSLLERPRDMAVLAPLIRSEITWRLLHGVHGSMLGQLAFANGHTSRIGLATTWIRENFTESMRTAELAALANMSVASFHRHFKHVTSITPVQFQKRVRLQEARRLLPGADSIAAVAYQVGYESLSQFNRDYRTLFKQTPSHDAAALRAAIWPNIR